jgi:hypothetical protein
LRTDLSLPEDELSEEQKAWKILFNTLDKSLEDMLGLEKKEEIDNMLQEMDNLKTIQKALELKMKRHGVKDNGRLILYIFLIVGFLLSWVLTGSFLWGVVLGLLAALIGLIIGASIFESSYSQSYLASYLDKLARWTGSASLRKSANNMRSKSYGLDELEKIDNDSDRIVVLHKKLNDLFNKQHAYMAVPFSEEATYRKNSDALHEKMLSPEKTNEEHIKTAQMIISIADKIIEISITPLRKVNDEIQQILVELDKEIKKATGEQKRARLSKWFDATNDFYLNRRIMANYTISSVEWDKKIPESVIKHNGDINAKMSSNFAVEMQKSSHQAKVAGEKDEKLNETRKKLADEAFGILAA